MKYKMLQGKILKVIKNEKFGNVVKLLPTKSKRRSLFTKVLVYQKAWDVCS